MTTVAVVGLAVLAGLAIVIGLLSDRQSRTSAWTRIAVARRVNAEHRTELEERELASEVRADELAGRERILEQRELNLAARERRLTDYESG